MTPHCPRVLIAGVQSGVGKTSVSLALVRALTRRGLRVQTFKAGPDFLDPSYLTIASGRPCYNLDGWMSSREYVCNLFLQCTGDADIAVIEGVMGLFDGVSPVSLEGSTAEIARWLNAPVLLVVSAHGVARSLAATVKGYTTFEPGLRIAGVIVNHSGSDRHASFLAESLRSSSLPPLLGAIPRGAFPLLPSRHLGLVTADAANLPSSVLDALAAALERHCSLEEIQTLARSGSPLQKPGERPECRGMSSKETPAEQSTREESLVAAPPIQEAKRTETDAGHHGGDRVKGKRATGPAAAARRQEDAARGCEDPSRNHEETARGETGTPAVPPESPGSGRAYRSEKVRIGIAYDAAFHFYYQDHLDQMEEQGAELIRFSPIQDQDLPQGLDGLYIGGGYPEEYAEALSGNPGMLEAVRQFARSGRPLYAECGGLIYLSQGVETQDGKRHPLAGLLPAWIRMERRLQSLGYVEVTLMGDSLWGPPGTVLRGHEFHYSNWMTDPIDDPSWQPVYALKRHRSGEVAPEGFQQGKTLASYIHLHLASHPEAVRHFLTACGAAS